MVIVNQQFLIHTSAWEDKADKLGMNLEPLIATFFSEGRPEILYQNLRSDTVLEVILSGEDGDLLKLRNLIKLEYRNLRDFSVSPVESALYTFSTIEEKEKNRGIYDEGIESILELSSRYNINVKPIERSRKSMIWFTNIPVPFAKPVYWKEITAVGPLREVLGFRHDVKEVNYFAVEVMESKLKMLSANYQNQE